MTLLLVGVMVAFLQAAGQQKPFPTPQTNGTDRSRATSNDDTQDAERDLQLGISLTRRGQFQQAIPHLKQADGVAVETFAVEFNLGLCYLGTRQFPLAIRTLSKIRGNRQQMAPVKDLLAQAYLGNHQPDEGMKAFKDAAAITPDDEKLYDFVSDACLDEGFYGQGVEVTDLGLRNLPNSARLFLQRGLLRSRLEEIALANQDFERAAQLAPQSDIGYIATVQAALSAGNMQTAIGKAREALQTGHAHYMLLTMLGEALLRSGGSPADLAEAQASLEKAVAQQPGYSSAQISLGKLYLMNNRVTDAITHLEVARQLDPGNPAVYSNLAVAYRRMGDGEKARGMLAMLADLNGRDAERIGSGTGGHSGMVAGQAAH